MIEVFGAVLAIGAVALALSEIRTGVLVTSGLFLLALAGVAWWTCTGQEARLPLAVVGVVLVMAGEALELLPIRQVRQGRSRVYRD